jgi:hypothetical protein
MDKELEGIMNEINEKIKNKLFMGGREQNEPLVTFKEEGDNKYVKFHGRFKQKARSIEALKPLIDYLDRKNYTWI